MRKIYWIILFLLSAITIYALFLARKGPCGCKQQTTSFTQEQTTQIEKVIHDYLLNNPQILLEASDKLRAQKAAEKQEKNRAKILAHKEELFSTTAPGRLAIGNPQGKVIMVEFTQHQCSHCKMASKIVSKFLITHPEVQLLIIYWPFFGGDALYTASAVLAAQKQNKGAELEHAFATHTEAVNKKSADAIIKNIPGLDEKKLTADIPEAINNLKENFKLVQELELTGTPAFMLANRELTKFSTLPEQMTSLEGALEHAVQEVS